jgi:invasion protein IalB
MAPSRKPPSDLVKLARRSAHNPFFGDRSVKLATLLPGFRISRIIPATIAALAVFSAGDGLLAQQAPKAKAQGQTQTQPAPAAPPPAAAPAQPGWAVRCSSPNRDGPLECAMEQNAVLTKTGQLVVLVNIRVPGDSRAPVALVQLPLGLNLQAGTKFQVDDGKSVDLPIQTCENRGCYASIAVSAEMLAALKAGKQLKILFQDLAKETITVAMPLNDFTAAYDKIK